ncbi:MAG TPA: SEC-C domain-containing protein, partial [Clostridiales bacterium]|nr:SEC-C domain-containing protein [Clostridiales bacterium]
MSLLQEWRDYAYAYDMQSQSGQMFWANYFNLEKGV